MLKFLSVISSFQSNTIHFLQTTKEKVPATKYVPAIAGIIIFLLFGNAVVDAVTGPTIPSNLKSPTRTAYTVTLSWSPSVSSSAIKNYTIYRNGTKVGTSVSNQYVDSGLKALTSYSYTVTATDQNLLTSAKSTALTVVTLAAPPTALKSTSISQTQVGLSWTASLNSSQLTGYYVYRNGTKVATVPKTTLAFKDSGLVAGTLYAYSVKGYYGSAMLTTAATLSVKTAPPTPIASCKDIATPGYYQLTANVLTTTSTPCISIHDTSGVYLDCKNFKILSSVWTDIVTIENTTNYSFSNCFVSLQDTTNTGANTNFRIDNSSNGVLQNNTFTGGLSIYATNVNHTTVATNTFKNAMYVQESGSYNSVQGNTLSWTNYFGPFLIGIMSGSSNKVINNTMNGYGGGLIGNNPYGEDDGIVLKQQDSATVTGNTMSNFYDCGIETVWYVNNSTISNNTINSASQCGIGGWYGLNFHNNIVSANKVDTSIYLFYFYRTYNLDPSETAVHFDNNQFTGNVFTNGKNSQNMSGYINPASNTNILASLIIAKNDVFKNNNFGPMMEPYLAPSSLVVDGGGNICASQNYSNIAHIICH